MKECKILLIDPFCKNPKYESPNAKLGYTSAILEKKGYETEILDFLINDIENVKEQEFLELKRRFYEQIIKVAKEYKFVYINCEYGLLKTCIDIAKMLPENIVIVGGTFTNYLYAAKQLDLSKLEAINYISLGDPECDVINIVENKEKYIVEKYKDINLYNSGMINKLDEIPYPNWGKYDLSKYDGKLYLVASKSCSYNKCKFCDERLIWGNRFRIRNYENIIDEIKYDIENYHINQFFFWDASITAYPYLKELCERIIEEKIECKWTALIRADEITEEMAILMKNAGCYSIEIGIESLNNEVLESMNKGEDVKTIVKAIEILKKNNIIVEGSFLIGYYEDTKESILNTIEESKKLNIDFYRWHNLELAAEYLLNNPNIIEAEWHELDLNFPNQFLNEKIIGHIAGYFDMHIVSKMGDKKPKEYPNIKIGNLTLMEIHDLTRKAINETADLITEEGHNPYI